MKKFIAVSSLFSLAFAAAPVFGSSMITVDTQNDASIQTVVTTVANSGGNSALGGNADNDVSGGNVADSGNDNTAGSGDVSATGGEGGSIETGSAISTSAVETHANQTDVDAAATGVTDPEEWVEISVRNRNRAEVATVVETRAGSGGNALLGGEADNDVESGDVSGTGTGNTAGNSSVGSMGGAGGSIMTGNTDSLSSIMTVVNRTMTRIRR